MSYGGLGLGFLCEPDEFFPLGQTSLPPSCTSDALSSGAKFKACAKGEGLAMLGIPPGCEKLGDKKAMEECLRHASIEGAKAACSAFCGEICGSVCGKAAGPVYDAVIAPIVGAVVELFSYHDSRPPELFGGGAEELAQRNAEDVSRGLGAIQMVSAVTNSWDAQVGVLKELYRRLGLPGEYTTAEIALALRSAGLHGLWMPPVDPGPPFLCHRTAGYANRQCRKLGGYTPWANIEIPAEAAGPEGAAVAYVVAGVPEQFDALNGVTTVSDWLGELNVATRRVALTLIWTTVALETRRAMEQQMTEAAAAAEGARVAVWYAMLPTPDKVVGVQRLLNPVLFLLGHPTVPEDGQVTAPLCGAVRFANRALYLQREQLRSTATSPVWARFQTWIDGWNVWGAIVDAWCASFDATETQKLLNPVLYLLGYETVPEDSMVSPELCGAVYTANLEILARHEELQKLPIATWEHFQRWIDAWNAGGTIVQAWCAQVPKPWPEPEQTETGILPGLLPKSPVGKALLVGGAVVAGGLAWHLLRRRRRR